MEPVETKVAVDESRGTVSVTFDRGLCPLVAIYGAAYVFIDRFYVFLDSPGDDEVRVCLKRRSPAALDELEACAGEFANELLTHCWRSKLLEQNRPLLEAIASQAMAGAMGTAMLDDVGDLDDLDDLESFNDDVFDDPLGIAESWEQKQAEQPATGDATAADQPEPDPDRKPGML